MNRSVCPTASVTPAVAAAAIIASASSRLRAIGFSTSTGTPAVKNELREVAVQLGRHGQRHGVDLTDRARGGRRRARVPLAAAISSARARFVSTTATRSTPGERRQNPGVVLPEVTDADDGDSQGHGCLRTTPHHEDTKKHEEHEAIFFKAVFVTFVLFVTP